MATAAAKVIIPRYMDELVIKAKTDAGALGDLYELYYDAIFQFCARRLFIATEAEEVTSEVFLTVARQIRSFRGTKQGQFKAWLYRIAANKANEHIRRKVRRETILAAVQRESMASAHGKGEDTPAEWPEVYRAMLTLKPADQTLMTLRFFENFTYDEIAATQRISKANARVRIHRAIQLLREKLGQFQGVES